MRRAGLQALALVAGLALVRRPARAQAPHAHEAPAVAAGTLDSAAFLARARAATARYREQASAIADGFRPLGPDFPGMAQHWISVSRLMRGGFDAAAPQVLSYADVGGAPELVGVAWTVVLSAGESPPPSPGGARWHEHARTIDEESAMLHQLGAVASPGRSRLAMLHAWLWLPNPEGTFASDNWAVPFRRAGLAPPATMGPRERDAARALSLLGEGVAYWEDVARVRAALTDAERRAIAAALAVARDDVTRITTAARTLDATAMDALAAAWRTGWERAAMAVAPTSRPAITAIAR